MRLRALVVVAVTAGFACGGSGDRRSPTAPAATARPALTGTWTGFIKVLSCPSTPSCAEFYTGRVTPFMLTVRENQGAWEGNVEIRSPITFRVDLSGTLQPDGAVLFSGATVPTTVTSSRATIDALRVRADLQRGLTGSINYTWRDSGSTGIELSFTGEIPSASLGGSLPPDQAASLAGGTWTGETRLETCSGAPCGTIPLAGSYQLVVRDSGAGSYGALLSLQPGGIVADLSGTPEADGSVRFTGSFQSAGTVNFLQRADITRFVVRPDGREGLTGSFEYASYVADSFAIRTGSILSGRRSTVTISPGDFQGVFRGDVAVRHCTGDCDRARPGEEFEATWSLAQAGSSIVGQVQIQGASMTVPLAGSAAGGQLRASGEVSVATCQADFDSSPTCSQRIRELSATIDQFGRLRGTFEYSRDAFSSFRHYSYTAVFEFWTVVKQ